MTLKEIALAGVAAGVVYFGILSLATFGTKRIEEYSLRNLGNYTEMWPAPDHSGAVLVDNDGDGTLDRKYTAVASRQGYFHRDWPITMRDQQVFSDMTSKVTSSF